MVGLTINIGKDIHMTKTKSKNNIDVKKLCDNLDRVLSGMKKDGYDMDDAIDEIFSECPQISLGIIEDVAERVWNQ